MSSITNYLQQRAGFTISTEVSDSRFLQVDTGAVEIETGELLYGFIRRLKPTNVLTTGVYTGVSDLYISQGLKDNGFGSITALEFEPKHIERATELWRRADVNTLITTVLTDSLKFIPDRQYQFMFLDTELHLRFHELVRYFPHLDPGGYIFVHDMPRNLAQGNVNSDHPEFKHWPVGELPQEFIDMLKNREIVPFYFGDARGLVAFYKPHTQDYGFRFK